MRARKGWTTKELMDARRMRSEGMNSEQIGIAIGRSMKSVQNRLKRPNKTEPSPRRGIVPLETSFVAPPSVVEQQHWRNSLEHHDITARLMGDPLPGESALEKRA